MNHDIIWFRKLKSQIFWGGMFWTAAVAQGLSAMPQIEGREFEPCPHYSRLEGLARIYIKKVFTRIFYMYVETAVKCCTVQQWDTKQS